MEQVEVKRQLFPFLTRKLSVNRLLWLLLKFLDRTWSSILVLIVSCSLFCLDCTVRKAIWWRCCPLQIIVSFTLKIQTGSDNCSLGLFFFLQRWWRRWTQPLARSFVAHLRDFTAINGEQRACVCVDVMRSTLSCIVSGCLAWTGQPFWRCWLSAAPCSYCSSSITTGSTSARWDAWDAHFGCCRFFLLFPHPVE